MAYWLVMQGKSFEHERQRGLLWAPAHDGGPALRDYFYWKNLERVESGDLIFSYVKRQIVAVSVANESFKPGPRPPEWANSNYPVNGRRISVTFTDIEGSISLADLPQALRTIAQQKYGFIDSAGNANQGYLFGLDGRVGRFLADKCGVENIAQGVMESAADSGATTTEIINLRTSRLGQGQFRNDVLRHWGNKCCVSGLDVPPLLVASHIKPWTDSNDRERLDPDNGLLLGPAYDAVFDRGLCSFNEKGDLIKSSWLSEEQLVLLGITKNAQIVQLTSGHQSYLEYHRTTVLKA